MWSNDHQLKVFSFEELMTRDDSVLNWLEELEVFGATKIIGVPRCQNQGPVLADRVGMVKRTFFGYS